MHAYDINIFEIGGVDLFKIRHRIQVCGALGTFSLFSRCLNGALMYFTEYFSH